MRYMNWDVLIFPETGDTKTPLQEFSTACTVIQDPGLDNATVSAPSNPVFFATVTHPLPTVSCFVPSLLPDSPLKVSLHSWATPVASRATQSLATQETPIWFEAKVLLDGVCVADSSFGQESSWPQILTVDKDNKHEQIRFPPFHQELLTQVWANPAQGMGTIRILVAEGINKGRAAKPEFSRLRNLVVFSFQHAPLHILENCGIAWPNPGMWWQAAQQFPNLAPSSTAAPDPDAHTHSPRRRHPFREASGPVAPPHMSQGLSSHPAFRAQGPRGKDPFWSQHGPMHDPFTGAANPNSFYKTVASRYITDSGVPSLPNESRSTSTSHDESMPDYSRLPSQGSSVPSYPMPDYSRPLSPASSRRSYPMPDYSRPPTLPGSRQASEPTNELSLTKLESMLQSHQEHNSESQFEDMIALISPRRSSDRSGISAPSNTRVNSASNTPIIHASGMSAAAQIRASSYAGRPCSASLATSNQILPSGQIAYDVQKPQSDKSSATTSHTNTTGKHESDTVIKKRPAGRPKGRKEGKASEEGELNAMAIKPQRRVATATAGVVRKENETGQVATFGDGKRRRATSAAETKTSIEDRLINIIDSSPARKISKTGAKISPPKAYDNSKVNVEASPTSRSPLGELENRP